ncbi:MAG: glycosyltransferase family 4 protein [Planctomycetes bacterium]|nr:glycosyltransferase family 4 protein [Planctomycetota bacterium]
MKIVHIITRLILGGAQENTLITCKLLAERGHDVTLITGPALGPEGQMFDETEGQKYKTIVVDKMRRAIKPVYDLISYRQIKKILTDIQPDIVHTHSAKAGILGRYAAYALKNKWSNPKLPQVVHTIHGLAFHPYQSELINKFYIAIEKKTAKKTDAFLSVADVMNEKAIATGIGNPGDFTTAYSAIEEDQYLKTPSQESINDFRRKHGIGSQAIVITCIARLAELKGHEYIIESAKRIATRYPDSMWLFVGDGALSETLKDHIQMENLTNRFRFTGMVDPTEIPQVLHSSDILVHCSLREGLARVLPQAMLAGKPAISFDIDGAKEVVNDNTGRLVEAEDVDAFTDACEELIRDKDLRERLGANARESVVEKFAPDTMVDTIEAVYRKLM